MEKLDGFIKRKLNNYYKKKKKNKEIIDYIHN